MRQLKNNFLCRICQSTKLYPFLSLGSMPIPNGFLEKQDLKNQEKLYPLQVSVCENCWLVQLKHVVSAEEMFKNYLYIPSTSFTMLEHFKSLCDDTVKQFNLDENDLVVDIGSNDGTLLGFFKEQEIKILGVDPATNLANTACLKGIETINNYFSEILAKEIVAKKGKATVITACNVVAHINDLDDFFRAMSILLKEKGTVIIEFPYFLDLLDKNEFDTIYHEHLSYFSLFPFLQLLKKHHFLIFDIKRIPVHGGSLRIHIVKEAGNFVDKIVNEFLDEELAKKIDKKITYQNFAHRVKSIKRDLVDFLGKLKKQGKRIAGYGAAAKGNVLLNYCQIGIETIEYIVDSIPYKQGRYTPGTHIPIYPESRLEKDMPDYVLLLAWNFADEILRKQMKYREKGGQFIITIPYLRIE